MVRSVEVGRLSCEVTEVECILGSASRGYSPSWRSGLIDGRQVMTSMLA